MPAHRKWLHTFEKKLQEQYYSKKSSSCDVIFDPPKIGFSNTKNFQVNLLRLTKKLIVVLNIYVYVQITIMALIELSFTPMST